MNKYDNSAALYSPDGRVLQVEYATRAVGNSFTAIGIRGKDAVVLAVDKIIRSSLYEPDADGRILTLERNIGMAMAGFTPDGHFVAEIARQEAANYRLRLHAGIPIKDLCERVASFVHANTMNGIHRPLGLSAILASWDAHAGPQLFRVDPDGSYREYYACAIGRGKPQAMREFDRQDNMTNMETKELVKAAGEIIYKSHFDRQQRDFLFEMGIVGEATKGIHLINPTELTEMARFAGSEALSNASSSSDDPFF
ncbi:proteasome subunit alpha type-3-like [Drosophila serrata]|uniref:proteasome subunit alpha type-3-like n=1 Tax=Drosophila serrata TaxID=7274 RepID=UPI000A1D316D|nr:proteasome subunit alpha type-3-like [Drosophila serrata]XP_020810071.1 proteasome subunit alpha type-3-like [Drosophila serrata]